MKKSEVIIYEIGFEVGAIIEVARVYPARVEFADTRTNGVISWFSVSEYDPIIDDYINTKYYDTAHYRYAINYR